MSAARPATQKRGFVAQLLLGFLTLLSGMWVTLKNLFRRPVTLRYPRDKPELSPAFRSAIDLVRFEELDTHDCIACMQCVNICPSFCIHIEGQKHEGVKRKRASKFLVDYALCSVCGLCIEVCPTDTLKYSKIYDDTAYERDAFVFDLLEPFRAREDEFLEEQRVADAKAAEEKAAAAAKKKAVAAKAAAAKKAAAEKKATEEAKAEEKPKAEDKPKAEEEPEAEEAKAEKKPEPEKSEEEAQ